MTQKMLWTVALAGLAVTRLCAQEPETEKLVMRSYPLAPTFADQLRLVVEPEQTDDDPFGVRRMGTHSAERFMQPKPDHLKMSLIECGLTFPEGSFVRHNTRIERLFMKNTEANHKLLAYLLRVWNLTAVQVAIDFAFVSFERSELDRLGRQRPSSVPSTEDVRRLQAEGKGTVESATTVVTRSGQNATVKGVKEIIYGTTILQPEEGQSASAQPLFDEFETREVGAIINVTPTLGCDGETIDLVLQPELTDAPEWKDPHHREELLRLPWFFSRNVQTSVVVRKNKTLVMGGMPTKDGKRATYVFVTARLLDWDGNEVPDYDFDK